MKRFEKELYQHAKQSVPDVFDRVLAEKGHLKPAPKPSGFKRLNPRLLTMLLILPLALMGFILLSPAQSVEASSSVTLDFDTAIRMELDENGEVIDIVGVNASGAEFAEYLKTTIAWEGLRLSTLLPDIWDEAEATGRIEQASTVIFDVATEQAPLKDALRAEMIYHFETIKQTEDQPFSDVIEVPSETILETDQQISQALDISPAKARLIDQILQTSEAFNLTELQQYTHRELIGVYRSLELKPSPMMNVYMPPTAEEQLQATITNELAAIEARQVEALEALKQQETGLMGQTGTAVEAELELIEEARERIIDETDDALEDLEETYNETAATAREEAQARLDAIKEAIEERKAMTEAMRESMMGSDNDDDNVDDDSDNDDSDNDDSDDDDNGMGRPDMPENPGMPDNPGNPGNTDDDDAEDDVDDDVDANDEVNGDDGDTDDDDGDTDDDDGDTDDDDAPGSSNRPDVPTPGRPTDDDDEDTTSDAGDAEDEPSDTANNQTPSGIDDSPESDESDDLEDEDAADEDDDSKRPTPPVNPPGRPGDEDTDEPEDDDAADGEDDDDEDSDESEE